MALVFVATYAAVFIAEIAGDKLLFTAAILATRYRPLPIVCGVSVAFGIKMAVAVVIGRQLASLPPLIVAAVSALGFMGAAYMLWRQPSDTAGHEPSRAAGEGVIVSFTSVLFAEWGDIGQLTAAAMAARFGMPVVVWCGAVAAMVTKGALAATVGAGARQWIRNQLSNHALRAAGATLLVLLGLASMWETLAR